jgi:hypothetical protein
LIEYSGCSEKGNIGADGNFVSESENGIEDIWWILEWKDYPRL